MFGRLVIWMLLLKNNNATKCCWVRTVEHTLFFLLAKNRLIQSKLRMPYFTLLPY
uniref:Uncharacterized protein n=1 Tax=Arundo donax TaxID=35708 RepID=A0A0A9C6F3_ARUDO